MPKAEVGSTKHIANKLKSKGLQRLRWFCQPCEKQCRDENGFKCHVNSESHLRQMVIVGEDPRKAFNEYSKQFQRDFLQLLRTSHSTKMVQINHFYQEYIANKEHVHMNATKWPSLTEFAKFLGREGICRVEENEKGIHVAWIDNSPDALRRQDASRKKERMDKGDEEREQRQIEEQVKRAQELAKREEADGQVKELKREEGQKISLNFGVKRTASEANVESPPEQTEEADGKKASEDESEQGHETQPPPVAEADSKPANAEPPAPAIKMSFGSASSKPKNVFAAAKKNPLASKKTTTFEQPKKMSEAERIMKEEMARKQPGLAGAGPKRQKVG